jgi:hypothetical protein
MPRTEEALDAILRELAEHGRLEQGLLQQGRASFEGMLPGMQPTRPLPPLDVRAATTVHRVKVGLRGAKPSVWRRLEVPSDLPLGVLHEVLQTAFGWFDCHPHQFETACGDFGDPAQDGFWSRRADESAATLAQVAPTAKDKVGYVYDFGDDWRHDLVVEAILPAAPGVRYPRCTTAEGAPPDEDCGGIKAFNARARRGPAPVPDAITSQLEGLAVVVVPGA